ncbi:MAG: hypothetical protein ACTHJ3_17015 [Pararhizobium sp.]
MKPYDLIIIAAAAAFFLGSGDSANDSEQINVELPAQYQLIWDQSPALDAVEDGEIADQAHGAADRDQLSGVRSWLHHSVGLGTPIFRPRERARS